LRILLYLQQTINKVFLWRFQLHTKKNLCKDCAAVFQWSLEDIGKPLCQSHNWNPCRTHFCLNGRI
jgi:hypothetical protein